MADSTAKGHPTPGSEMDAPVKSYDTSPSEMTLEPTDGRSECGSMRISESELRYVGGDHWAAILEGISDLKDHLEREEQLRVSNPTNKTEKRFEESSSHAKSGYAMLLYGGRRLVPREEIIAALPPKTNVDRYVSRYFNYLDLVSSCQYSTVFL